MVIKTSYYGTTEISGHQDKLEGSALTNVERVLAYLYEQLEILFLFQAAGIGDKREKKLY